ncbi:MAG: hypothetical protein Q7S55_01890, partial [Nanoarchaeota archaeon]|nr:hypothetical protein [Nanoarchaeota archaeon]
MLTILKKIGKILWLTVGGFIFLWIGYFIYKLHIVDNQGLVLLLAFLLMFSLALAGIYIVITITGKI